MNKVQSKTTVALLILAIVFLIAMLGYAYYSRREEGKKQRSEQTNQSAR